MRAILAGCGAYLPEKKVTNDDLSSSLDTSHEWIESRTGITQRFIANAEETTAYMAMKASKEALGRAGIAANAIDVIIVATTTPDAIFPSVATELQHLLGAGGCAAFDIQAVCSGFVYALSVANNFIRSKQYKNVLVVGAETMSRIVDWSDRSTCVLFGDGAGAILLTASEEADRGILSTHLHADGQYRSLLYVNDVIAKPGQKGSLQQKGLDVYKLAIENMSKICMEALEYHNLTIKDVDWLIPHQANKRIIEKVGEKLQIASEKVIITVDKHANTSAATIPLAIAEGYTRNLFKKHDILLLCALGGGLTWGSCLLKW